MTVRVASDDSSNQIQLPKTILQAAHVSDGTRCTVRVRNGIIELVPEHQAQAATDAGLGDIRRASMERLGELWDNTEDDVWNEV